MDRRGILVPPGKARREHRSAGRCGCHCSNNEYECKELAKTLHSDAEIPSPIRHHWATHRRRNAGHSWSGLAAKNIPRGVILSAARSSEARECKSKDPQAESIFHAATGFLANKCPRLLPRCACAGAGHLNST